MFAEVKKCADNHDIKGLHYIFVDSLDVDPTFEKYKEDYLYCKEIVGFFDSHNDMTPIQEDKNKWNMAYWEQLKLDLVKNFSQRRFEHMLQVAKVVYSDKIERLLIEREGKNKMVTKDAELSDAEVKTVENKKLRITSSEEQSSVQSVKSQIEKQDNEILAKKRALELQNQKIENVQKEQRARIEAANKAEVEKKDTVRIGQKSKKSLGITLVVLVLVVLIVVMVLIKVL